MAAPGVMTELLAYNFNLETQEFLTQFSASPGQTVLAQSLLHDLARDDDVLTAELLIDEGFSPSMPDDQGLLPLHEAARHGSCGMIDLLLAAGETVEAPVAGTGQTALLLAALHGQAQAVRLLLARGATPKVRDWTSGQTPLHAAALRGDLISAGLLIAAGADVLAEDGQGRTPRDLAAKAGRAEMEHALLKVMEHRARAFSG